MCFQIASHCRDLAKCQWAMKCIQDLRAFMFPTAKVTETEQATISSASISRDALAPLLMVEWQDDFDPLITKNNRGSVMVDGAVRYSFWPPPDLNTKTASATPKCLIAIIVELWTDNVATIQ